MNANDPFGRTSLPPVLTREGRVQLLAEFVADVYLGKPPSPATLMYLAAALDGHLRQGGDLARDYLRIKPRRGSKRTPAEILRREIRHHDESVDPENPS